MAAGTDWSRCKERCTCAFPCGTDRRGWQDVGRVVWLLSQSSPILQDMSRKKKSFVYNPEGVVFKKAGS